MVDYRKKAQDIAADYTRADEYFQHYFKLCAKWHAKREKIGKRLANCEKQAQKQTEWESLTPQNLPFDAFRAARNYTQKKVDET